MASLLLWWSPDGAPIDEAKWASMVAQVATDAGLHPQHQHCQQRGGEDFRAFTVRTHPSEPEALYEPSPGTLVLANLRHSLSSQELTGGWHPEPAAIATLNLPERRLSLSRDLLGHRRLLWTRVPGGILAATREESLLAHSAVGRDWDEAHIAAMLATLPPEDTSTPFKQIRALAPGVTLVFEQDRVRTQRASVEPCDEVAGRSDRELADRFRELLCDSVRRASRGAGRIGVAISSGLDAATLAAVLMHEIAPPCTPLAVCYGYRREDGADVDERGPARSVAARLGMDFDGFDASRVALGLGLKGDWISPLGSVRENPYREIKSELYRRLASHGVDVMLAGYGADQFARLSLDWICSAWANRRWDWIGGGLRQYLGERGLLRTLRHPSLRRLGRYLWGGQNALQHLRTLSNEFPTRFHEAWFEGRRASLERLRGWPEPLRALTHLNALESSEYAMEEPIAARYGLDIRCPYRDWHLLRFVLSTPSYLMTGPLGYKWMLRHAASGLLEPAWIERGKKGSLASLWQASFQRQGATISARMAAYPEWLARVSNLDPGSTTGIDQVCRLLALRLWSEAPLNRR